MKDLLNCPNCGAPIQDDICPYCGSVFLDWASFDIQRPTFVKVKDHSGNIRLMKLGMASIGIHEDYTSATVYADNNPYLTVRSHPDIRIEAEFYVQPFFSKKLNKDVFYVLIQPDKVEDNSLVKEILEETK